jgi:cytidine deaminase
MLQNSALTEAFVTQTAHFTWIEATKAQSIPKQVFLTTSIAWCVAGWLSRARRRRAGQDMESHHATMATLAPVTALTPDQEDELCRRALQAKQKAYAPYSNFSVGAALLCDDGVIVDGCNVENASYGLCICAERTAVAAAVASGRQKFRAVAVATRSSPPSPPCGMCRQVLIEFASDMPVLLVNDAGERQRHNLAALLPGNFTIDLLRSGQS